MFLDTRYETLLDRYLFRKSFDGERYQVRHLSFKADTLISNFNSCNSLDELMEIYDLLSVASLDSQEYSIARASFYANFERIYTDTIC